MAGLNSQIDTDQAAPFLAWIKLRALVEIDKLNEYCQFEETNPNSGVSYGVIPPRRTMVLASHLGIFVGECYVASRLGQALGRRT